MAKFDPTHMDRLVSPERYRWQNPEEVLDALGLAPGMVLADVGAGPGFYTLPAAARVGPGGKVYALDIEPKMLERLSARAAAEGVTNVEAVVSQEDRLPLPDGAVDAVLAANVLHEVPARAKLLREIARVLRPGGALAVVEWRKEEMEKGPPFAERLTYRQVARALRGAGFHAIERFEVGPYHYGMRARQ